MEAEVTEIYRSIKTNLCNKYIEKKYISKKKYGKNGVKLKVDLNHLKRRHLIQYLHLQSGRQHNTKYHQLELTN